MLQNCFTNSTGLGLNVVYVNYVNTVSFPDLVGASLPALSIYQGTVRQNVISGVQSAMLALKIPQWGG